VSTTFSATVNLPEHLHGSEYYQCGFATTDATGTGVTLVDAKAGMKGVVLDLIVSGTGGANTVTLSDEASTLVPALNIPDVTCVMTVVRPIRASAANSAVKLVASAATALSVTYHYCYESAS